MKKALSFLKSLRWYWWILILLLIILLPLAEFWVPALLSNQKVKAMISKLPRGQRNNNPLNIRISSNPWKGKTKGVDTAFETFESMEYGIRAAIVNIRTYLTRGVNTVEKIISTWAPSNENDTQAYIQTVCKLTGFKPSTVISINQDSIYPLVNAMSQVESKYKIPANQFNNALKLV